MPLRFKLNSQVPFGIAEVLGAMEPELFQAYQADHRQPSDHPLYLVAKILYSRLRPICFGIR